MPTEEETDMNRFAHRGLLTFCLLAVGIGQALEKLGLREKEARVLEAWWARPR